VSGQGYVGSVVEGNYFGGDVPEYEGDDAVREQLRDVLEAEYVQVDRFRYIDFVCLGVADFVWISSIVCHDFHDLEDQRYHKCKGNKIDL
jgi:hypothetical protein